ncbi:hypothetical protein D3C73_859350 [compost metagenome]
MLQGGKRREMLSLYLGWRMIKAFIMRCDELRMYDCLEKIPELMGDYPEYAPKIWEIAEFFFSNGKLRTATALYEGIVTFSEQFDTGKLAMCQFRLWQLALRNNFGDPYASLRFAPFRHRLPKAYALEGLLLLAKNHAVRDRWEEAEKYADELYAVVITGCHNRRKHRLKQRHIPQYSLITYYGEACLLKAAALEQQERYLESMEWIKKSTVLSRFEELDEQGRMEAERFRVLALGSRFCIEVKQGNRQIIAEYAAFLQEHESEVLRGLVALLISANTYDYSIDQLLSSFADLELQPVPPMGENGMEQYYFVRRRYIQYCYHYADYYFRRSCYDPGAEFMFRALELAIVERNYVVVLQCTILFEKHREHFTSGQTAQYEQLCEKIKSHKEPKNTVLHDYFLMLVRGMPSPLIEECEKKKFLNISY